MIYSNECKNKSRLEDMMFVWTKFFLDGRVSTDCINTRTYSLLCEVVASQSAPIGALTRDRQTDTSAAKAGVARGWSTEKLKWIYQVVQHLKISLYFQGHNVKQGGEDGMTKKSTFLSSFHPQRAIYSSQENHEWHQIY